MVLPKHIPLEKIGREDIDRPAANLRNVINLLVDSLNKEVVLILEDGHYFGKVSGIFKGYFTFKTTPESPYTGEKILQSSPDLIEHSLYYSTLKEIKVPFDKFQGIHDYKYFVC